jgi:hypothetical protein
VGDAGGPLLSICVPTFNRSSSLQNLFASLAQVKSRFGEEIEICVSDNASTDDTSRVIEGFAQRFPVDRCRQASNIGGTLNIIAVAGQMRARWGIWCGDDDEVDLEAIGRLLVLLRTAAPDTWLLVDSGDLAGRGQYMLRFAEGAYDGASFRREVLRTGLDPFGFMGVHVFPRCAMPMLQRLGITDAQPWPHMAGLLRHMVKPDARLHVMGAVVVLQAKGGARLFWAGGDLARIRIAKLRILRRVLSGEAGEKPFCRQLMVREMYSLGSIKAMAAWKLYEVEDFDHAALGAYFRAGSYMGGLLPVAFPYLALALLLRAIPHGLYAWMLRAVGKGALLRRYLDTKRELGAFDGIKRGI